LIPLVSVVVPIYNKEKFLRKCVGSLQKQTIKDIQIILVNDGSNDGSLAICKELAAQDRRITVLDQKNGGVSAARNSGLAVAEAAYVGFVDPDDWVESDMYESMLRALTETASDVCLCNISEDRGDQHRVSPIGVSGIVEETEIVEEIVSKVIASPDLNRGKGNIMGSSCRLLLKRELLIKNGIRFPEGIPLMEDTIFCVEAFLKSRRICIEDSSFYHYEKYGSSATNAYLENSFALQQQFHRLLENIVVREGQEASLREELDMRYISMAISAISNEMNPNNPKAAGEKRRTIRAICADRRLQSILADFNMEGYTFRKKTVLQAMRHKWVSYLYSYYALLKKISK